MAAGDFEQWTFKRCNGISHRGQWCAAIAAHRGDGGQQTAGVRMLWVGEELGTSGDFYDSSLAHHSDSLRDLSHHRKIVRDKEQSGIGALFQFAQQIQDLCLHGDIESGGWFVGNQQAGAVDESHRDQDALPLAAGKLMGIVVKSQMGIGNGDRFEGFDGALAHGSS
jgi:hypothetical protein